MGLTIVQRGIEIPDGIVTPDLPSGWLKPRGMFRVFEGGREIGRRQDVEAVGGMVFPDVSVDAPVMGRMFDASDFRTLAVGWYGTVFVSRPVPLDIGCAVFPFRLIVQASHAQVRINGRGFEAPQPGSYTVWETTWRAPGLRKDRPW